MRIIFNPAAASTPARKAFVFEYTQYDHKGHQISEPTYPDPYAKVLVNANSSEEATRLFKGRFPRSIVWNLQLA